MIFLCASCALSAVAMPLTSCLGRQSLKIQRFELESKNPKLGGKIQLSLVADLLSSVHNPTAEIQLIKNRIPEIRYRDSLCQKGILSCPAASGQLIYGSQMRIPNNFDSGDYQLKLIFKDGKSKIGCYECPITIE